jgi:nicotinate phosphoribosyltransferase
MVYKLAAVGDADLSTPLRPVAKRSSGKQTRGGRKDAQRRIDTAGLATGEDIDVIESNEERARYAEAGSVRGGSRGLLRPLVTAGQVVAREDLDTARRRHQSSVAELPLEALLLEAGEPALPTILGD